MSYHSLENNSQDMEIPTTRRRLNSIEHFASSYQRSVSVGRSIEPSTHARSYFDDDGGYEEAVVDDDSSITIDEESHLLPRRLHRPSYSAEPPQGSHVLEEHEIRRLSDSTHGDSVILRKIEDEETGEVHTMIAGQSTVPQTIFNSVNVLIGVGLLALPLGFKYSGWLFGGTLLTVAGAATFYTAILLSKCLDTDYTLLTFADIAYAAFGKQARIMVAILFTIELLGSGVALVVLLADSLNALFPALSITAYKIIAFFVFTPMTFLPLRLLSMTSIMGIVCTVSLVFLVIFNGLIKPDAPGSLLEPETTWWLPRNWKTVPLSIGLLFSPFGGLPCLVSIRTDMRHPQKYAKAMVSVYTITMATDAVMGVVGFLMYGQYTKDEVTKNLLSSEGYPSWVPLVVTILVGLVPLSKGALSALPICHTADVLLSVERVQFDLHAKNRSKQLTKALVRVVVIFLFVFLAILFPDFDRIVAFAGSLLCISTCIILPCAFYLKIYSDRMPLWEKWLQWVLLIVFTILAAVGTVWSLLPESYIRDD